MDKAPDAYRTISEVAEDLDLPQHVLRFWETRFGQIKPLKRGGGRRYYRPDDIELLKGIRHLLYKEGYTIKGVQRILKEQGVKAVQAFVRETMADPAYAPLPPPPPRPESVIRLEHAPVFDPVSHASAVQIPAVQAPVVHAPVVHAPAAVVPQPIPPPVWHEFADEEAPFEDGEADKALHEPAAVAQVPAAIAAAPEPGNPVPIPPVMEAAPPAPRPQVSMFRGGLQRAEHAAAETHTALPVLDVARAGETPGLSSRDALMMALDELQACRAAIDRVLSRRMG